MKNPSFAWRKLQLGAIRAAAVTGLLSALFSVRLLGASAGADDFRITVRSSIDQVYTRFSKEPPRDHGRSYVIIAISKAPSIPLVKPADEGQLLRQLRAVLSAHGFHEPAPGTNPDIVLTVLYGRSQLRNPYLDKTMETYSPFAAPGVGHIRGGFTGLVVTASADQIARERSTPGYAEKVILASGEKLFIAITAWKFPATSTEKPKQLWRTTTLIDDGGQDLNPLSEKMLAAGGRYFDRPMDKEEVAINSSAVEGRVILGMPSVVEPTK